ncbi:MAG: sigma-70 family RNA polymerase sigma factor [Alteromonadaceae bacterium]|nr:sigma-70 family RNA polymerase sigma factor [Alteromonadaceae bacterium]
MFANNPIIDIEKALISSDHSFEVVWREHYHKIKRCCTYWLKGDLDAIDDAMSLTAEKILTRFRTGFDEVFNTFAFIYRVSRNVCMDIHRSRTKRQRLVNQVEALPNEFFFSSNHSEPLESSMERSAHLQFVVNSIDNLPVDMKHAISARFIHDMDYSEIANRLKVSEASIRKRVQLARKKIKHQTIVEKGFSLAC